MTTMGLGSILALQFQQAQKCWNIRIFEMDTISKFSAAYLCKNTDNKLEAFRE